MNKSPKPFWVVALITLAQIASHLAMADEPTVVAGQGRPKSKNGKVDVTAEDEIRAALEKRCQIKAIEEPLQDVIKKIEKAFNINIQLDTRALDSVGIGNDTPITRNVKDISLRSALRLMLRELELTWMIQDEVLLITTPEEAEANLITRVYPVRDLLPAAQTGHALVYSPYVSGGVFESLIETIEGTVAPDSWENVGGPGSVDGLQFADKYVLVISQTEEVHAQVKATLELLRKVEPVKGADNRVGKKDEKVKADEVFVKVYPVTGYSGGDEKELAELIQVTLEPKTWNQEQGTYVHGLAKTVVIRHNQKVHQQAYNLLVGISAILPKQTSDAKGGSFQGSPIPVVGSRTQ